MVQHIWRLATTADAESILEIAQQHFQHEIFDIFVPDPPRYLQHVLIAIIEQSFDLLSTQLIVAEQNNQVIAYSWLKRNNYMTYAKEEVAEVLFAHCRLNLSARSRITLVKQMIQQWELWCKLAGVPVLVSSTIRSDQTGFLRLHEQMGFTVRGSMAFKRIIP